MSPRPEVVIGRLSGAQVAQLLARGRRASPTYGSVGDLLREGAGRAELEEERVVGRGGADFARACAHLRSLGPQRSVAQVWPPGAVAELGATVLVALPFGPVTVVALNRVVAVVDEPRRWGFAYGTLPGHAEVGEEAFVVTWLADDTVVVRITATARVALPGARLVQPLLRPVQRRFARRYLDAVAGALGAP